MSLLDFLRPQGAQMPGSMTPRNGGDLIGTGRFMTGNNKAGQPVNGEIMTLGGPLSGLARILQPEVALPMAAALLGNQGNMQNLGNAFGAAGQGLQAQQAKQAELAQQNKTYEFFKTQAPEFAQMIDAGMPVDQAWQTYTKQRYAQPANGGSEVYGTPIYGTDPDSGETVLGVIAKDGSFRKLDTGGVSVSPGTTWQDFGTYKQPFNTKNAQPAGAPVAVDNAGVAAQTKAGGLEGEDAALYKSVSSKMPGLEAVIQKLDALSEKATYTYAGQGVDWAARQAGMEPREAAVARTEYIATVDNQVLPMLRDTFGAAFTVKEGETLRATLGDPDKSPKEKQAVLKAFIEQKRRDVEALAARTGQAAPQQGGVQRYRFNPATGELE
jgi:hypothetical protein